MRNHETGLDYAKFDHSDTRIRQAQHRHEPGWQGAWIWCLKFNDEESAHLIRIRNDERYAEECEQRAREVFPVTSPQFRSLTEVQSEIESSSPISEAA